VGLWNLGELFYSMLLIPINDFWVFSFFPSLTAFTSMFYILLIMRCRLSGHLNLTTEISSKFIVIQITGLVLMLFPILYAFLCQYVYLSDLLFVSIFFNHNIGLFSGFWQCLVLTQFTGSLLYLISEKKARTEILMQDAQLHIKYAVAAFFLGHFGFLCSEIAFSTGFIIFANLLRVSIPFVSMSLLLVTLCKIIALPKPLVFSYKNIFSMMLLAFLLGFSYGVLLLQRAPIEIPFLNITVLFVGISFALFNLMLLFMIFGFVLTYIIVWQFKRLVAISKHVTKIWRYLQGEKTSVVVEWTNIKEPLSNRQFLIYSFFQLFIYSLSIFAFFIKEAKSIVMPLGQLSIESTFHEFLLQYFDVYIPCFSISPPELFYMIDNPLVFGFTFSLTLPLIATATFLLITEDSGLKLNSTILSPKLLHKYVLGIYILSFLYFVSTSGRLALSIFEAFILIILEIFSVAFALTVSRKYFVNAVIAHLK
jgi:hypothetical protein